MPTATLSAIRFQIAGVAALLVLAACQGRSVIQQMKLPGASEPVRVEKVETRSVYLDAVLVGDHFSGRLFFPANDVCKGLLVKGAERSYRRLGDWGEVTDGEGQCPAIGLGGLEYWRDQNPKPRDLAQKRSPARFEVVYTDEDYALARGRFPLASAVYWKRSDDTLALIPRSDACREPLERGEALMKYRTNGSPALELVSSAGVCPIEGLITPSGPP